MIVRYVAPASRPLVFLHIHDEDREADLFSQPERVDGWTRCGLPFKASELWVPVECRQSDRLCVACVRTMKREEP